MNKKKPTLSDFTTAAVNRLAMLHVRGGGTTVPPQGDPGDTNDPTAPQDPPPPPRKGFIDPTPDFITNP